MKKSMLIFLAALTLACNAITDLAPTPTSTITLPPEILHFENDLVSFDYPAGMRLFISNDPAFNTYPIDRQLGGELIVGLADPQWIKNDILFSSIGVYRHPIPPGSNLETFLQDVYQQEAFQTEVGENSAPVTFSDLPAYQRNYRIAAGPLWYSFQDTWIEKEGQIVRLSVWEEVYSIVQPPAEMITGSLVIKDNLPPIVETPLPEPTPSPTPIPPSMLLHFENDMVAFDYLKGMTLYSNNDPAFVCYPAIDLEGEMVAGLGDARFFDFNTYFRSIRITRRPIPPGSNLEAILLDTYQQAEAKFPQEPGILNANRPVTVAGLAGIQKTYRVYSGEPAYELRDIWLQNGNEIFIISIWTEYTNPDDFATFQSDAEVILKSLQIK